MSNKIILIVTLASLFSLMGTMLGASIGVIIRKPSRKTIANINGVASGLMLSIIMLDLIPESIKNIGFFYTIVFCVLGIAVIMIIDFFSGDQGSLFSNTHTKVAFMAAVALMIHNFPEGIIMGAGFLSNTNLGIKMSVLIAIHDIPEGIAVSAPLMAAKVKPSKIMIYAFITAFPTVIGAWSGMYIGKLSNCILGECLGFTSGIMMYVVFAQMIPESLKLWKGKSVVVSIFWGIILGLVITNVL